ncbi:ATP-binding protein [Micromonospora polyrhachis]|uniref:Tetratricopeptide (TPR) repeat protein n=1 Tax=Micromonospora polyrhachis TaxID=1282883 RepID=A0A7W7SMU0_9ACTN|nr:tetratricopeptide repeat protein [Micromonospora polyrhachis]MBB4957698.1 tetratricopeptide (TPR) repeat protein [Micromonospora polyrhachis]
MRTRSQKALALLAVLALDKNLRAQNDIIRKHIWAEKPAGDDTLRTYVAELRRLIDEKALPNKKGEYYELRIPREQIDYWRFRKFVARSEQEELGDRVDTLRAAVAMCGEPPLSGLGRDVNFADQISDIEERCRQAWIRLVEAEWQRGNIAGILSNLDQCRHRFPRDSTLLEYHMTALAESGAPDRIDALLTAYEKSVGVVSESVRKHHRDLTDSSYRPAPVRPQHSGYALPRTLPQDREIFGRHDELAALDESLFDLSSRAHVAVIHGLPGVGKTQLAVRWAHRAREEFRDGTLYADLHGYSMGSPTAPTQVLIRFIRALKGDAKGGSEEELTDEYRSALADRSMLVVLDNARDFTQVWPLMATGSACATLITSRTRLDELVARTGAKSLPLEPLDTAGGIDLLGDRSVIGAARVDREWRVAEDLVEFCGGLPLLLHVLGAWVHRRSGRSLAQLHRELRRSRYQFAALPSSEPRSDLRTVFSWSYAQLAPAARQLFRLLGLHPGATITLSSARHLAGAYEIADDQLIDAHLIEITDSRADTRLKLHDLLAEYARDRAVAEIPADERDAAQRRLLDYLLHGAYACDRALGSNRRVPIGPPPTGIEVPRPTSLEEAMGWFEDEYQTLLAAIPLAHEQKMPTTARLLTVALVTYQWRHGHLTDAERQLTDALREVDESCDLVDQATLHLALAGTRRHLQKLALAGQDARTALRLSERADDRLGEAQAQQLLGIIIEAQEGPIVAAEQFREALRLYRELDQPRGIAHALNGLANAALEAGNLDSALTQSIEACGLFRNTTDLNGTAAALRKRAEIYCAIGDHARGFADYEAAIKLYQEQNYRHNEARTHCLLGMAQQAAGLAGEARTSLEQARKIFDSAPARPRDNTLRVKLKAALDALTTTG